MFIKVRVYPGSKKESFVQNTKDNFEIFVKEKAERNMANKKILELVATHFKVTVGKVRILTGHRSPGKMLSIDLDS